MLILILMVIKYVFKNKGQNKLTCYLNNALHLWFLMLGGDDFLKLFSEALRVLYNPTPRLCFLLSFVLEVWFGLRSWIFKPVFASPGYLNQLLFLRSSDEHKPLSASKNVWPRDEGGRGKGRKRETGWGRRGKGAAGRRKVGGKWERDSTRKKRH